LKIPQMDRSALPWSDELVPSTLSLGMRISIAQDRHLRVTTWSCGSGLGSHNADEAPQCGQENAVNEKPRDITFSGETTNLAMATNR
jgi:hypothetical protein